MPSEFMLRPMDSRTCAALISRPFESVAAIVPSSPLRSASILVFGTRLIFAFFISRSTMADISSSSAANARGIISTTVTSAPKAR